MDAIRFAPPVYGAAWLDDSALSFQIGTKVRLVGEQAVKVQILVVSAVNRGRFQLREMGPIQSMTDANVAFKEECDRRFEVARWLEELESCGLPSEKQATAEQEEKTRQQKWRERYEKQRAFEAEAGLYQHGQWFSRNEIRFAVSLEDINASTVTRNYPTAFTSPDPLDDVKAPGLIVESTTVNDYSSSDGDNSRPSSRRKRVSLQRLIQAIQKPSGKA